MEVLDGSESWDVIMASQFRKLFELPVARCSHSAKLIHVMLSRQLVTQKKHELWFVYGGYPLRFSLREFFVTTGLRCSEIPSDSEIEDHQDPAFLSVWNRLFGEKKIVTVSDCLEMLKNDLMVEPSRRLSHWKKLSLALLVIVDGVVVCSNKNIGRVSPRFVEMLHDSQFFLSYPWGREAFNATMERFGPYPSVEKPLEELKKRLGQHSSCCYGFPLALQLQVLKAIPVICNKIKDSTDLRNFIQRPAEPLSRTILLRESDVVDAELDQTVSIWFDQSICRINLFGDFYFFR